MLNKLKQRKQEGFTIIEVMIVLAIAALILLVVLLAVPALQRNSRNTTLKDDAGSVMSGISTFASDNNGTQPSQAGGSGTGAWLDTSTTATANRETVKLQANTQLSTVTATPTATGASPTITPGQIQVEFGTSCPTSLGGTGVANPRAASAFYVVETSGGVKLQCVDS